MEKVKRKMSSFLPPQDGQEWVTLKAAAEMLGMDREYFRRMAKKVEFTCRREAHTCAPCWFVRAEIMQWKEVKAFRRGWLRRNTRDSRLPRYTEAIDEELARRIFIGTKEAAAILGVGTHTVSSLVQRGRLVSYQAKPGQHGSRLWFSRRAVEQLKEEETRKRCQAAYARGRVCCMETNRHGRHEARTVRLPIPAGWLTTREAAERLGVHPNRLRDMRATGRIRGERLWNRKRPLRFWYFPIWEVERLLGDEMYRAAQEKWRERQRKREEATPKVFLRGNLLIEQEDMTLRPMLETWKQPHEPDWVCDTMPL